MMMIFEKGAYMEKVKYNTDDGNIIVGILDKSNKSDICVIMCHGIRADKDEHGNFIKLSEKLNEEGIDNIRFDFRGHGESNKTFSEVTISGEIKDLETTIEYITDLGYKKIIILGASFGGGITGLIEYSKYNNVIALVLWYPALIYSDVNIFTKENIEKAVEEGYYESKSIKTGRVYKFSKGLMLESLKYKPYEILLKNTLQKLLVHGNKDEIVSYKSTEKLANESTNIKLLIVKDGTHGFFDNEEHINDAINNTVQYIKNKFMFNS